MKNSPGLAAGSMQYVQDGERSYILGFSDIGGLKETGMQSTAHHVVA